MCLTSWLVQHICSFFFYFFINTLLVVPCTRAPQSVNVLSCSFRKSRFLCFKKQPSPINKHNKHNNRIQRSAIVNDDLADSFMHMPYKQLVAGTHVMMSVLSWAFYKVSLRHVICFVIAILISIYVLFPLTSTLIPLVVVHRVMGTTTPVL